MIKCTISDEELMAAGNLGEGNLENQWILHVDGLSNINGLGVSLIFASLEGDVLQYALCFRFSSINNEAEYEALIASLRISRELGVLHLKACSDFQLIVGHVRDESEAREESMKKYLLKTKDLI